MLCLHSETGLARGVNHNTITIRLPWPDAALWQNARVHWAVKGSATRNARANTAWECKAAGSAFLTFAGRPKLAWSIHKPPKSRADMSNVQAALKAAIDGIQDALMIDDNKFIHVWPEQFGERVPGGLIVVTITDGGNQ